MVEKIPEFFDVAISILDKEGFSPDVDKRRLIKVKETLKRTYDYFEFKRHEKKKRFVFLIAGKEYMHLIWINMPTAFEHKLKKYFKIELKTKRLGW